ncbi:MAG: Maf family nucleotide pyrophosphatase [Chitinophagaceae bacterium]
MAQIILASGSPRRKQLLAAAEIDFEVRVSDADESYPLGLPASDVPEYIARNKALATPVDGDELVIAADTIVVIDGLIIGKPVDKDDAIRMLSLLAGKTHVVYTGVVMLQCGKEWAFTDKTEVVFNDLSVDQISYYVNKYNPLDKAGAYAIQEWIGYIGIKSITGDYYNVMGLPVNRVVEGLKLFGV